MKYCITIGGREVDVDVEPRADGRYVVTFDGRTYVADLRRAGSNAVHALLVGARSCEVAATRDQGAWKLDLRGRSFTARVESAAERAARALAASTAARRAAEVKASMPGFVTRVLVAAGDEVRCGTPLMIIEAMKMENEIRAEFDGIVAEIAVTERQTVNNGDVLVRMS